MALADLLKKVHGPDKLSPSLDLFIHRRDADYREPGWHPSSFCGVCVRRLVLERLLGNAIKSKKTDPKKQRIFDVGKALHRWYQEEYFGKMGILWGMWKCSVCGYVSWGFQPKESCDCVKRISQMSKFPPMKMVWEYKEVPVRGNLPGFEERVVGHGDGLVFLKNKWYLLELKTINSWGFGKLQGPMHSHFLQSQIYGELITQGMVPVPVGITIPRPSGIIVFYIDKNTSSEKEYLVELDSKIGIQELSRPLRVEQAMASRLFPEREEACVNALKNPAKSCPVGSYCFGSKTWDELEHVV